MFVCAQTPLLEDPSRRPRACVFILSRRSLDNVIVDLATVSDVEATGELAILRVESNWQEPERVLGVWIHNDSEDTRKINVAMIEECWKVAKVDGSTEPPTPTQGPEAGPALQAIGRSLTLNELFASQAAK